VSSAQNETFSPRNLTVFGVLLFTALILGEVVFSRHGNDTVPVVGVGTVEDIAMRLKPVVTIDDIMMGVSAGSGDDSAEKTPKELYAGACLACHVSGVAGAPKVGDNAAWLARLGDGIDAIVSSAINGKGAMPANGGSTYSEEQIRAVVEYMLAESGL
jgi:cytochrome c5